MDKLLIMPITDGYHYPNGSNFEWYSVVKVTSAEIAFIREQSSGHSCIDLKGVVIGFLSYENSIKHSIETGKLLEFHKIADKMYYNKLLKKDLNYIKRDIVFDYIKSKISTICSKHSYLGDIVEQRIIFTEDIAEMLSALNNNIFNIKYLPYTVCHRLTNEIENLFRYIDNTITIEKNTEYLIKERGIVLSNTELTSIPFKDITIYLELVYSNIMKDSHLPNCYIYEFAKTNKLSIELIEILYPLQDIKD